MAGLTDHFWTFRTVLLWQHFSLTDQAPANVEAVWINCMALLRLLLLTKEIEKNPNELPN